MLVSKTKKPFKRKSPTPKGLPGKSYLYIVELDNYLRKSLSILSNTNIFDVYVSSYIRWMVKSNNRKELSNDLLNYLSCYGTERIDFILPSRLLSRSDIFSFLTALSNSIKKYKDIIKNGSSVEEDDVFAAHFRMKWENMLPELLNSILDITDKISSIYSLLIDNYLFYIVKKLMTGRKGESNPDNLNSDAYEVLVAMVDSYNTKRSKIPFNKYLNYFILLNKDKVIKHENWGLDTGKIISLNSVEDKKDTTKGGYNKNRSINEELLFAIRKYSIEEKKDSDSKNLIDNLNDMLPKPFYKILSTFYGIIDPLTPEEEVQLILNN